MKLDQVFGVAPRYVRSINIERDLGSSEALEGYVLTSTAYSVLGRLLTGMRESRGNRAWNLTGSYGSGKSAFALFTANLLSKPEATAPKRARSILREQRHDLHREFFESRSGSGLSRGYLVLPISGSREALVSALGRACGVLRRLVTHKSASVRRLSEISRLTAEGRSVTSSEIVAVLCAVAREVHTSRQAKGVLLIIDELGKFLEHAALDSEHGDIFVLQQLAEASALGSDSPIAIITVLHQAFEQYASLLPHTAQTEWAKVQGRFEDIAFQEPPDQVIALLASAIAAQDDPIVNKMRRHNKERAARLFDLGVGPAGVNRMQFISDLSMCAPIHPVAVLALSRLARKFGQNQRSIFSFLTSREPFGFTDFLSRTDVGTTLPVYSLSELFDYTSEVLGSALSQGDAATKWSAALAAIDRAANTSHHEMSLLKSVGLISAVGAYGEFKPSPELLRISIDMKSNENFASLETLLSRSLLIERRYNGTVGLWDGSDIDIDEQLREASTKLPQSAAVADSISAFWRPRAHVAKSHSFRTGTLRYFAVQLADSTTLLTKTRLPEDADGLIVIAFGTSPQDCNSLEAQAETLTHKNDRLVISVVRGTQRVSGWLRQLELLRFVEANTPELQSDEVARRELRNRKAWTERQISLELESVTTPGRHLASDTVWFTTGARRQLHSVRELSELLSSLLNEAYRLSPEIQNELVNRRSLSSAAAAARRNLLEAMIERPSQAKLGFSGQPPEVCIYNSLLQNTGLHCCVDGVYAFCPPREDDSLHHAWTRLEEFLDATEHFKGSVSELFTVLQDPPYGLKMGVIPILFTAACLTYGNEIALYEDGVFTPELTIEAIERMLRYPNRFHVRRYRVEGLHRLVFTQIAAVVQAKLDASSTNLVELMRPLYKLFNGLPPYTRQTRRLSQTALAVRAALSDAREPDQLIFSDLPAACGCSNSLLSSGEVENFIARFRSAIHELARAYETLLEELKASLFRTLQASGETGRAFLREHAEMVSQVASDSRLRAFCLNIAEDELPEKHWIEAVSTAVVGKAPKTWTDADRTRYDVTLAELARSFRNLLALAIEQVSHQKASPHSQVLRAGIADLERGILEETITVRAEERGELSALSVAIEEFLKKYADVDGRIVSAALTITLRDHIQKLRELRSSDVQSSDIFEVRHD